MQREIYRLSECVFDLCIIGGGIYGACAARDAALRGLSVALIDKGDFGNATSSNSLRIIHGGFRYLQNGDILRVRESIRERMNWMRIAPHLIHPLPILIPTYRRSLRSKHILSAALVIYDLLAYDRNRLGDPQKHIPNGRVISKHECLQLVPQLDPRTLTGAAKFYDCRTHNSERLLLAILISAAHSGAVLANYVEATGFLRTCDRITGVRARDVLSGNEFDIRSRVVVNAAGPWVSQVLDRLNNGQYRRRPFPLLKAFNLVVKQFLSPCAVGLQTARDRLFFITPWHNRSLIGTGQLHHFEESETPDLNTSEVLRFVGEINRSNPGIRLSEEDILFVHAGLVPAKQTSGRRDDPQLATHTRIVDHMSDTRLQGLITVIGVKFTTARIVAERVVDLVFRKLDHAPSKSRASAIPIYGGSIDRFDAFLRDAIARPLSGLDEPTIRHLVLNYGSAYEEILRYCEKDLDAAKPITCAPRVLKAEVLHAVRHEMASKLADVVFRRTDLAALGFPGDACLAACASVVADELGWDRGRTDRELTEVKAAFSSANTNA